MNFISKLPGCENWGVRSQSQTLVLWPRATNHGELHLASLSQFRQIGNTFKLVQGRGVGRVGRKIMDQHAITMPLELLRQKKSGRFLGNVSVWLVSHAQDRNHIVLFYHGSHFFNQILVRPLIHPVRRLGQRGFQTSLSRRVSQQTIVTRKTRSAIAQTRAQIFFPDATVAADGVQNGMNVRLRMPLGNYAQLVGEADFS